MKLWEKVDPFFTNQPPLEFINELSRPLHVAVPRNWGKREARPDEAVLKSGVKLIKGFEDPEGLLNTAYDDFDGFLKTAGIQRRPPAGRRGHRHARGGRSRHPTGAVPARLRIRPSTHLRDSGPHTLVLSEGYAERGTPRCPHGPAVAAPRS